MALVWRDVDQGVRRRLVGKTYIASYLKDRMVEFSTGFQGFSTLLRVGYTKRFIKSKGPVYRF